jgi:hypothetical protein
MKKYSIPEKHNFSGEWWLPAGSPKQISGALSWEPRHATLELHHPFEPQRGHVFADETHEYAAIHGLTTRSELVTVLDSMRTGSPMHIGAGGFRETERLISSWVVVGAHVSSETLYTEVRARIPGLQMWFDPAAGISQDLLAKTEGSPATIIYEIKGVPETLSAIPCIPATLAWGTDRNFSGSRETEFSVTTSGCLAIRPQQPQTLRWFFDHIGRATSLLGLVAGAPMSPDHFSANLAEGASAEVLVALRDANYCPHRSSHDFFMLRQDMGIDVGTAFAKWFELYDRIAMPSKLALSVLYSEGLWLHVEFLSLMQALEGFHRATMSGLYLTKEQYEPFRKTICDAVPASVAADHRAALNSKIRFGHEFSLRKRLDALVRSLEQPLRKFILGGDGTVPSTWVDARNYYTHWDEALRVSTLDGPEMHRASFRMKHLLRVLYLDLVGIPQSTIAKSLQNSCRESQYLIQLNNQEFRKNHPGSTAGSLMHIGNTQEASVPGAQDANQHSNLKPPP